MLGTAIGVGLGAYLLTASMSGEGASPGESPQPPVAATSVRGQIEAALRAPAVTDLRSHSGAGKPAAAIEPLRMTAARQVSQDQGDESPRDHASSGGTTDAVRRYYPGYAPVFIDPFDARIQAAVDDAYQAGRADERREESRRANDADMQRRAERLLSASERATRQGVGLIKAGQYQRAIVALEMAAALNRGDPACRIHLAQARLVLGQYRAAGQVLRRAFELQPKLVYVDLNLAGAYPDRAALERATADLEALAAAGPLTADEYLLLGFIQFQQARFDAAHRAFRAVAAQRPRDEIAKSFLKVTQPAAR
jgi:tetratricopeptide (TPR) repeat protein